MHRASLATFVVRAVLFTAGALVVPVIGCTNDEILAVEDPDSSVILETPKDDAGTNTPTKCGNGILDDGEACDDGNTKSGDGCSATCTVEDVATSCPGTPITLTPDGPRRVATVTGNTQFGIASLQSNTCGGGSGQDLVYTLSSDITGAARVKLTAQFDAILGARTACADANTEISCKQTPLNGGVTDLLLPVTAGQTIVLVIDGVGGKNGEFTLEVDISPSVCGDGIAQFPEQCDDGNAANGDGCSATCTLEQTVAPPGMCPGAPYTLVGSTAGPRKVSFAGDISKLANTMGAFGCSGASGRDQVYAITPTISGAITAELVGAYVNSVIHVRGECFSSQTEIDCREQPLASVPVKTTFPVTANNTYFIFVDTDTAVAAGPASGLYTLDVTLQPATCGNGVLESPEECDDGNTDSGDGCSDTCTLEAPPAGFDSCPGATIAWQGDDPNGPLTFKSTASTTGLAADIISCGNGARVDVAYSFVAPYNGWLSAKAKGDFNIELSVRRDCNTGTTSSTSNQVGCADTRGGDDEETVSGAVEAGITYYVIVEGGNVVANSSGVFTLDLELTPSVCGNGVIEGGETCDDGAFVDGDGCAANCQLEPTPSTRTTCATAEPFALTESEPGVYTASVSGGNWNLPGGGNFIIPCNGTGREAYFTITPPISGVVTAVATATYNATLGARGACPPNTGNAYLTCSNRSPAGGTEQIAFAANAGTTYWIILDAATANDRGSYTLDVTLKDGDCGDGLVTGEEECDDGNTTAGDGCNATCKLEPLAGADTCPGHAVSLTGVGTAPRQKVVTLSNAALLSHYAGTCGGIGRDGVVAVTSDIGGTMTAQLKAGWPAVFYARATCTDGSTQLDCQVWNPAMPHLDTKEMAFPVSPGVPVYFFVDSLDGSTGPATLSLTVTP